MAISGAIPVAFGEVLPVGAFVSGEVERMKDWERSTAKEFVQAEVEAIDVQDVGERRWAEWWALPSHDVQLGAALLAVFDAWDGDDSMVTYSVHEQFKALDRRLMAYEDWCADLGIQPARRARSLRVIEAERNQAGRVCGDCHGSGIVVDDDGSVSGQVGTLIDCGCTNVPCLGLGVLTVCSTALGRALTTDERQVALLVEYLAQCRITGADPDWCLTCGAYVAESLADCSCGP